MRISMRRRSTKKAVHVTQAAKKALPGLYLETMKGSAQVFYGPLSAEQARVADVICSGWLGTDLHAALVRTRYGGAILNSNEGSLHGYVFSGDAARDRGLSSVTVQPFSRLPIHSDFHAMAGPWQQHILDNYGFDITTVGGLTAYLIADLKRREIRVKA
jgi:hypothetical protein